MDNIKDDMDLEKLAKENQVLRERLEEQGKKLKQFGDELQTALNQYETLFHEAPAGYVFLDAQYKIRKASDTFCRLLNKSRFYFIGRDFFEYVGEEFGAALKERLAMAFLMNTPQKSLLIKLYSDVRRAFWVELKFQPAPYEDRSERMMLLSVNDVDNIAEFEQKLRRSDARARLLLNSTDDGAMLITPEGRILDSNKTFESYSNIFSLENRNYSFYDYLIDTNNSSRRERIERLMEDKKPYVRSENFGGRRFDIRVHPFLNDSEEVEYVSIFIRDTTEAKMREEKLELQASNLEAEVKRRTGEIYEAYERLKLQVEVGEQTQSKLRESETAMQSAYASLAKRESLLENIASHLTELLENENIEEVIHSMLVSAGDHASADRVYLFKRSYDAAEGMHFYFVYEEWAANGKKCLREFDNLARVYLVRDFVGWEEAFLDKEAVNGPASSFDKRIRKVLELTQTKSILALPVFVSDQLWGFVGFDNMRDEENWKAGDSATLSIIADSIGAAFERRERVRQLNEQTALLETMIENLPVAVFAKNAENFKHVIWNKATERLTGVDKKAAIGRSNFEVFPLHIATNYHRQDLETLNSGSLQAINEETITHANGEEKIVRSLKLPIYDAKGKPSILLGISVDITESVKNERALKLYAEELEKAKLDQEVVHDKLSRGAAELEIAKVAAERANRAKSEFLANMSHELRTPMNAILGFTEIMKGLTDDPKMSEYLSIVESSGKSLLALMNDILDVSRIETGRIELNLQPVDLAAVIDDVMRIYSQRAKEKKIELRAEIAEDFPAETMADEIKFRQILFNLIGNAIKFTDEGSVAVRARKLESTSRNDCEADIVIEVIDTGIGIDPDQKEHIFESFYRSVGQSSEKYEGVGLGLAIVKKLVEKMDGSITVNNKPGGGSAFRVTLKNVRLSAHNGAIPPTALDDADPKTLFEPANIMIIDDSAQVGESLRAYFDNANFNTLLAKDAAEALRIMMEAKPDLIFADVDTIKFSGLEPERFALNARDLTNSPIVALMSSPNTLGNPKGAPFDEVLRKSFKRSDLAALLRRYLKYESTDAGSNDASVKSNESLTFDPESLKTAEESLIPVWNKIRKTIMIERTQEFARMNVEAGNKYAIPPLCSFGEKLLSQIERSNIVEIRNLMQSYKEIFQSLKKEN